MTKVAYNRCFGGFSISTEAVRLGREISGNPKWGGELEGESYDDGSICTSSFDMHGYDLDRTDPTLIKVIEQLGERANGMCAKLAIKTLPEGSRYRIDEYDGRESVMSPGDYDWSVA